MLQRVNPLVPNKLHNINRRINPSEHKKKCPDFDTTPDIFHGLFIVHLQFRVTSKS
jgi:hypothetical protein